MLECTLYAYIPLSPIGLGRATWYVICLFIHMFDRCVLSYSAHAGVNGINHYVM